MNDIEFLNWVRGPAFEIASIIFVAGVIIRILEILLIGRKPQYAEGKGSAMASGLRTVVSRTLPAQGTFKRSAIIIVAGYLFHIGLLVTIFLFAPHILMFKDVTGLSWPSLPTPIVDALTVVSIIALIVLFVHRMTNPVLRYLTNKQDLLVWAVTLLPLLTGYMAYHHIGTSPQAMLGWHILSVELLMVVFPFTKLMHAFTLFMARWYNGATAGYRGVES